MSDLISRSEEERVYKMKEFIEKLIEVLARDTRIGRKSCDFAVEDVMNLAEEYNNGWIPCSERLPKIESNTSDTVLVCTIDGFQHMAFWCDDGKWRYCESGMIKNPMEWTVIIAWMPLPAPYKEGVRG